MGMAFPKHLEKPSLFLLGFGVITIYIPGIFGAAISTGWLLLLISIPILFFFCELKLGIGFAFICYAVVSFTWTKSLNIAFFHLAQLIILGCVFVIGQNLKDLKVIFKGLACGLGVSALLAIAQHYGFREIYSLNDAVAGLFINPNIYSEISVVLLISLIIFKLYWWLPVTLPGILLVQSRAALVALAVGLFILAWKWNKQLALISLAILVSLGAIYYWGRFDILSIKERLDLWADTINGITIFGNGVGSYEVMFPSYSTHVNTEMARPRYAHNDLLQAVFEFGIGSILLMVVLLNVFNSKRKEIIIVGSVFTISLFTYPIHVPATAFIAFLVAGYCVGNSYSTRNIWVDWRSILFKSIEDKRFNKARSG